PADLGAHRRGRQFPARPLALRRPPPRAVRTRRLRRRPGPYRRRAGRARPSAHRGRARRPDRRVPAGTGGDRPGPGGGPVPAAQPAAPAHSPGPVRRAGRGGGVAAALVGPPAAAPAPAAGGRGRGGPPRRPRPGPRYSLGHHRTAHHPGCLTPPDPGRPLTRRAGPGPAAVHRPAGAAWTRAGRAARAGPRPVRPAARPARSGPRRTAAATARTPRRRPADRRRAGWARPTAGTPGAAVRTTPWRRPCRRKKHQDHGLLRSVSRPAGPADRHRPARPGEARLRPARSGFPGLGATGSPTPPTSPAALHWSGRYPRAAGPSSPRTAAR